MVRLPSERPQILFSKFAPYARAVLTLTVRRSLAYAVGESFCEEEEARRLHDAAVAARVSRRRLSSGRSPQLDAAGAVAG